MKIAVMLMVGVCLCLPQLGQASSLGLSILSSSSMMLAAEKSGPQQLRVKNRQQATQMVKSQYGGKILSMQSTKVNGNSGYRAKLLSADGVVFYVSIDAVTGQMFRR